MFNTTIYLYVKLLLLDGADKSILTCIQLVIFAGFQCPVYCHIHWVTIFFYTQSKGNACPKLIPFKKWLSAPSWVVIAVQHLINFHRVAMSVWMFVCFLPSGAVFVWGLSLNLRPHEQFQASPWSTLPHFFCQIYVDEIG